MFTIFYFLNTSLLMILTSGILLAFKWVEDKFYSISLLEKESKLLGFLFYFVGTQLAQGILCLFQANNYSQQSILLLGGCWKRRWNILPTKWQTLCSFLGHKKLTFGDNKSVFTRCFTPVYKASRRQFPVTTYESVFYLCRVKFPALTTNVFLSSPKQRVL